ncbi:phosphoribosylglycinamide formyltransferase [Salicibibacter kimchii]|uniref:Phosphoribosylglycinamide formyltransferase n=1 Tax=Salicibibacter kimchii TaxID=2099786 RepID=A0A345C2U5_9BACI|nr:phosphoribosylglycinamide formyltransferase [Salicibibacter kimchii]AXF57526.1 phosphoribosylglycinamide formyltransferase [Salicibibacter kimchii]
MKIALFASGSGSNVEAILQAIRAETLYTTPAFVFSDRPNAPVLEKAKRYGVSTHMFRPRDFDSKQQYEESLLQLLDNYDVQWVVLAGYMRLLGATIVEPYTHRIVNIHPSLLPAFPGLDAVGQALGAGVEKTGVSIHYVDAGMDTGEIIQQETVPITSEDTKTSLEEKIKRVEHQLYPETLQQLFEERSKGVLQRDETGIDKCQ